jgi:exonuclease SbcC
LIAQATKLSGDIQEMSNSITTDNENYSHAMLTNIEALNEISPLIETLKQSLHSKTVNAELINTITELCHQAKQQLLEYKDRVKKSVTDYEILNDSIAKVEKELALFEKQQYQLASEISLLDNDNKLNQQRLDGLQDNTKAHFTELQTLIADVISIINKYIASHWVSEQTQQTGLEIQLLRSSIDEQTVLNNVQIEQQLTVLRQHRTHMLELKQKYNQEKQRQQTLTTELSRLTTQIETKQSQLDKESTELDDLSQSIAEQIKAIAELQQDRQTLFADKNVDAEEDRLRLDFEQAKTAQSSVQRRIDSAQQLLQIAKQQQTRLSSELLAAKTTLEDQEDIFQEALASSDFAIETDFVSARLSQHERSHLSEQQQQIDYQLKQAKSLLQQTEQALADKQANPLTLKRKDSLLDEQQQAQSESNRLIESIGAMTQKLKDNEDKKGSQQSQLKAIAEQKQNLQVWRQLNELIGSSSGKKFRAFAQGLTFDIMVNHANTQLHKMSDRYLLARDDNSPLELNVIDNYQGGEIRSTKNLSGGEGFIISLALALGLSKMASQNIRVDSLFLDEGFGTLDEESLDIALDTLTSLQQEGKLIGVISHVQALKERILTQIQVKKLSGGFSQITGQGCYHIASS